MIQTLDVNEIRLVICKKSLHLRSCLKRITRSAKYSYCVSNGFPFERPPKINPGYEVAGERSRDVFRMLHGEIADFMPVASQKPFQTEHISPVPSAQSIITCYEKNSHSPLESNTSESEGAS